MSFHSWAFLVLLALCLVAYHGVLRGRPFGRQVMLLVASYVFYGWWDWRFLGLIAASTLIDYVAGLGIGRARAAGATARAKAWLMVSLGSNLAILGFFKYFNFFADSAADLLRLFGLELGWTGANILLPVGISFYTFQTMAYSIDVWRGRETPCANIVTFALYVSFFPQLVAGPIERSTHLLPQLRAPARVTGQMVASGLSLILLGYFKKLVIADPIAPYVMETVATPGAYNTVRLALAAYLFSFQIYADFSGYSDIARGTARLFGVELIRNFEQPFFARTPTEVWQRWHISLSRWFMDYVYIPLGGSRVSKGRLYFNLFAVMAISGLWHGAGWTYIVWGMFHGLVLWIERAVKDRREGRPPLLQSRWAQVLAAIGMFHVWVLSMMIFFSRGLTGMIEYFHTLVTRWTWFNPADVPHLIHFGIVATVMLLIDWAQRRTGRHAFMLALPAWLGGLVIGVMLVTVIYWSDAASVPFIYFQF